MKLKFERQFVFENIMWMLKLSCINFTHHYYSVMVSFVVSKNHRIHGLFGGDFNLAVWRIFIGSPNLNHAVLTRTHEMN